MFSAVQDEALKLTTGDAEPDVLRRLDKRARVVLGLFVNQETIGAQDVAAALGLSDRMARELIRGWVTQDWLRPETSAKKNRRYSLSAEYRQCTGSLPAT